MPRLVWDKTGERFYETGVKHAVLYPYDNTAGKYGKGVAWNGITNITESPSGAEETPLYADDIKYLSLRSVEELGLKIEAYTYPDEWAQCDGSAEVAKGISIGQQGRASFALVFETTVGNDTQLNDYGKKLHIVYGCTAAPSETSHSTVNDSPEAATFSWEIKTVPISVPGKKPTASITIDSTKVDKSTYTKIEDKLFGDKNGEAMVLLPAELITLVGGTTPSTGQ